MKTALLILLLAACGDDANHGVDAYVPDVPADAMPRQTVMENKLLVINELAEAILAGGPGDYARIRMTAPTASLDWNMHGHANGSTQVVKEELKVMTVDYLFQPTAQADWYLLIRNKGQTDMTVQLAIELYGNIQWSGWQ